MRPRVALVLAVLFAVGVALAEGKAAVAWFSAGLGCCCYELMRWVAVRLGVDDAES